PCTLSANAPYTISLLLPSSASPRAPPSFPTRRSSDLSVQFGQSNNYSGSSTVPFNPVFTPSVMTPQDGLLSAEPEAMDPYEEMTDRKSTRLNSSHVSISYAVFCLKQKKIYLEGSSASI